MLVHANPRVYIGPNTIEIKISVKRLRGLDIHHNNALVVEFIRRGHCGSEASQWTPYAIAEGMAHFTLPEEFMIDIDKFPKGFYDGRVYIDGCHIGNIELVKAPGRYVSSASDAVKPCSSDTPWIEPDCIVENNQTCGCNIRFNESCNYCSNTIYLSSVNVKDGYVNWEAEDIEGQCDEMVPDRQEGIICEDDDSIKRDDICKKDLISGLKESNLIEGYADEDDC